MIWNIIFYMALGIHCFLISFFMMMNPKRMKDRSLFALIFGMNEWFLFVSFIEVMKTLFTVTIIIG